MFEPIALKLNGGGAPYFFFLSSALFFGFRFSLLDRI